MTTNEPPRRIPFLDGLRGLAAFYVLLFHVVTLKSTETPSHGIRMLQAWLGEGRLSVVFFIVLSGYSLAIPVARTGSYALSGGFRSYIARRARRILPPYYAALLLSILVLVAYNVYAARSGQKTVEGALEPGSIVSHLFLFHNLSFDWVYRINGPLWSVATEWQIYFLFAGLLLPLCRRAGELVTLIVAWGLGVLPFVLLPPERNFFWACPWFLGSFALGLLGASIAFAPRFRNGALYERTPWGVLALVCLAVLVAVIASGATATLAYPVVDLIVSLFAFCWINAAARVTLRGERGGPLHRLLCTPAAAALGGFSYSLYLIQHPILRLTEKLVDRLPFGIDGKVLAHLFLGTPVVMCAAWLFAEFFEKPFTTGGTLLPALQRRLRRAPVS